jgi:hypothetical protein
MAEHPAAMFFTPAGDVRPVASKIRNPSLAASVLATDLCADVTAPDSN